MKSISRHFSSTPLHLQTTTTTIAPLTIKTCINLLKSCKSMTQLKQIQAQATTLGLHQNTHVFHKLMAFTTLDPSRENLTHAQKILNSIQNPTVFTYNVLIKAHAKTGNFKSALFLFDELRVVHNFLPDNFTYTFVCKAIGKLKLVLEGEKVHGFAIKCGLEIDCYVCGSIMDMYNELGRIELTERLFEEMPTRGSVSWNMLIFGFVRSRRFEDAIALYRRMWEEGTVKPDEGTVVITLSACAALKRLELGEEIHRYVREELGFSSVVVGNALLDMYSKCGRVDMARMIFDAMPVKNVICWTSMVSGYVNSGALDEAIELFERSPARDLVLWTAMINGYVQFNRVDEAMDLFRKMQMERIKPDKFTMVALLTGCAQAGALEQGEWIYGYMKENRIAITAVVGTALIEMYAKCGCIEKSLEIFNGLKEKDTTSWTSIIYALAMNGKSTKALELFEDMKQAGFSPDDITFIGVLSACTHGGLLEEGRQYFYSMEKVYRIEPKLEHYGCLIDLLGRAGLVKEAEDIIDNIPRKDTGFTVPLYGALLSACRTYGNVDLGERVAEKLMEIESRNSGTHTLLANIYASANKWEDMTKIRRKMRTLGIKKSPGCSSIEVNGSSHEFIVGSIYHPQMDEIYLTLNSVIKNSEIEMDQYNVS